MEKYLPCYEKSFCERTEKTALCEITLPEYLPNAVKIVKISALGFTDGCEISKDSLNVNAKVRFNVVYLSDHKDTLKCTVVTSTVAHTFPAKGIEKICTEGVSPECSVSVSDEKGQIQSLRKMTVSCKVTLGVSVRSVKKTEIFDTEEKDNIHKLCQKAKFLNIQNIPKYSLILEENIPLDDDMPEIRETVYSECSITSISASHEDGKINYCGSVQFNCLYLGNSEEAGQYISFSKELPFSASVDAENISDGAFLVCRADITDVNTDALQNNYGDMKICSVSAGITVFATAYCECESEIVSDAFCTSHNCECEIKNISYDAFVCGINENVQVSESIRTNLGSITEIVSKNVCIHNVTTELSSGQPLYSVRAYLKLVGTNENGGLECVSAPFSFKFSSSHELSDIPDKCRFDSEIYIGKCDCKIENGEIKCDLALQVSSCIYGRKTVKSVTAMAIDLETELQRKKSEYILCYPCGNDTVWACAKRYRVSPEALLSVNGMGIFDTDLSNKKVIVIPMAKS